jgi:glycosyltransferase involved in cell wall biosynthesis
MGSAGGNQLADSKEFLEGQSQAGLQMGLQKLPPPRAAMGSGTSGDNSSSVLICVIGGKQTSGAPEAPSPATSHTSPVTAPQALFLDSRLSTLDTSAPADFVFLAFGQIRDGKNLDLFLRAMTHLPKHVKLLVAGKGDSGSSRPPEFYQKLAEELGVADRCRWDIRRIPEDEVGDFFAACDVVLVTYSAKFRSASGVLNAAVSARKPVLASSGSGPLKTVVKKYHLGVFVEPDATEETLRGAQMLPDAVSSSPTQNLDARHSTLDTCIPAAWDQYELENSWDENARRVIEKLK